VVVGGERHENGFGVTRRREWFAGRAGAVAIDHGDRNGACMYTNWSSPRPFKVFNACSFAGTTCSAVHPVFVNIRGAASSRHHYCVASTAVPLLLAVSRAVALRAVAVPAIGAAATGVSVAGAAGSFLVLLPLRVASSVSDIVAARGAVPTRQPAGRPPTSFPEPQMIL